MNEPIAAKLNIKGVAMVAAAGLVWSFGGTIGRYVSLSDSWGVVFWRSVSAAAFLLLFMVLRDGSKGTVQLFRNMGLAGLSVALCFAIASSSFVIALSYTTVANILLLQAAGPLMAALATWLLFGERISGMTWGAIFAVMVGVGIMVSQSFTGQVSPVGDGLALLISVAFATATVITRRNAHVRMTPAVFVGVALAGSAAFVMSSTLSTGLIDHLWLVAFGALNLGLGLVLFTTGARLVPAPIAALLSTTETVFAPIWVWLFHAELPSSTTLLGGGIVFAALLAHLLAEFLRKKA
jgi:drug/metabolite transporter (DMT)-like permease